MKKILPYLIAALALSGCATTQVKNIEPAEVSDAKAVVFAENYGYYLFGFLPIICGDPENMNDFSAAFFEDTVQIKNNADMIAREAEKIGAKEYLDVKHRTNWTGGFSYWIIWKQVMSSNATLK
ncbi:MAG: hypothetical protein J6T16_02645 [Opitutales bacterium]|nr:hypothetical protein [Opitutales bacterium]